MTVSDRKDRHSDNNNQQNMIISDRKITLLDVTINTTRIPLLNDKDKTTFLTKLEEFGENTLLMLKNHKKVNLANAYREESIKNKEVLNKIIIPIIQQKKEVEFIEELASAPELRTSKTLPLIKSLCSFVRPAEFFAEILSTQQTANASEDEQIIKFSVVVQRICNKIAEITNIYDNNSATFNEAVNKITDYLMDPSKFLVLPGEMELTNNDKDL